MKYLKALISGLSLMTASLCAAENPPSLALNDKGYLEMPGLNVMLGQDDYPEGHQAGLSIIQNGERVASVGLLRLGTVSSQWNPYPALDERKVDAATQTISARMHFDVPQPAGGTSPLYFTVRVRPEGAAFRVTVDLDKPLPPELVGMANFGIELFPGAYFSKSYRIGDSTGLFPFQSNGCASLHTADRLSDVMGRGRSLLIAPEDEALRMNVDVVRGGELILDDSRKLRNDGWFHLYSFVPAGVTKDALEWLVHPNAIPGWMSPPVIQYSQVGYFPSQKKVAVIELDRRDSDIRQAVLYRAGNDGTMEKVLEGTPEMWEGSFLRYSYCLFDFSSVTEPGLYVLGYGDQRSGPFRIGRDVFASGVWQPTLEYFLPVQMCHMRVVENNRVWHGLCHEDDALMAPLNQKHFDGYEQGSSTLCKYQPGEHVPGLDAGGWHDAGDYDLRIESQAETVYGLALAWELFHPDMDCTTVDQKQRITCMNQPDGKPDMLQQIEHGLLSIVGGYNAMGRLYRGIQDATLDQYTHLGDAATTTDGKIFSGETDAGLMEKIAGAASSSQLFDPEKHGFPPVGMEGSPDDRWVFTEDNPQHELLTAAALAACSRALRGYDDSLADDCVRIAGELWDHTSAPADSFLRLMPAEELYLATGQDRYLDFVKSSAPMIAGHPEWLGWLGARALSMVGDADFQSSVRKSLADYAAKVAETVSGNPYGVPFHFHVWGESWGIERFGVQMYMLHRYAPDIFPADYTLNAVNYVLGCHPGSNNASLVSGVGAKSMTVAYGVNRADFSGIPGGIVSAPSLIQPDFPEMKDNWPYIWQQAEYCLGTSTSDYVFLVLAAQDLFSGKSK